MENIKENISKNLVKLRKSRKLTQQDFAQIFNYSDKAVSRWERGESLPDIEVLTQICDYYGVEFSWLISAQNEIVKSKQKDSTWYRVATVLLYVVSVFTLATVIFVYFNISANIVLYQAYIWAVPASFFIVAWCCHRWWGLALKFAFASATLWSLLVSVYVQFLSLNIWAIFLLGIPLQLILVLTFLMGMNKRNTK